MVDQDAVVRIRFDTVLGAKDLDEIDRKKEELREREEERERETGERERRKERARESLRARGRVSGARRALFAGAGILGTLAAVEAFGPAIGRGLSGVPLLGPRIEAALVDLSKDITSVKKQVAAISSAGRSAIDIARAQEIVGDGADPEALFDGPDSAFNRLLTVERANAQLEAAKASFTREINARVAEKIAAAILPAVLKALKNLGLNAVFGPEVARQIAGLLGRGGR